MRGVVLYLAVARDQTTLAHYSPFAGTHAAVLAHFLEMVKPPTHHATYKVEDFVLHTLADGHGYVYCVLATEAFPLHFGFTLLTQMRLLFVQKYRGSMHPLFLEANELFANDLRVMAEEIMAIPDSAVEHLLKHIVGDARAEATHSLTGSLRRQQGSPLLVQPALTDSSDPCTMALLALKASVPEEKGSFARRHPYYALFVSLLFVAAVLSVYILVLVPRYGWTLTQLKHPVPGRGT